MLSIGDTAPEFEARTHDGQDISLARFREEGKSVVLYFYPKDETAGCTAQACAFRDAYEDFTDAGSVVIGVSHDDEGSHRSFAENHRLPFLLVSDADGSLRERFKVPNSLGVVPGRVTYVIDGSGKVVYAFNALLKAKKHVDQALSVIKRLGR